MAEIEAFPSFRSGGVFAMLVCECEANRWRCSFDQTANTATRTFRPIPPTRGFAAMSAPSAPRLPELRRRLCPATDPASDGVATWIVGREAPALRQTGASVVQLGRHCRSFGSDQEYSTWRTLTPLS